MPKIEKLLVTTDLSDTSEQALPVAATMAKQTGAEVTLLTVIDFDPQLPPGAIALMPAREQALKDEVRDKVGEQLDKLVATHLGDAGNVHTEVLEQSGAAGGICAFAKRGGFDLIVMASHGRSGIARLVLGSVAERVVRQAPCAVLTVPAK